MKIRIFYDDINYRIKRSREIKSLIEKVIRWEKKIPGDLNFIFTGDTKIRELNLKYLEHDYFTDVIAFNYSERKVVNGEIYLSVDTIRKNAINYKISLSKEILRVMVHGTLHLCGLDDRTVAGKAYMSRIEDKWIKIFGK